MLFSLWELLSKLEMSSLISIQKQSCINLHCFGVGLQKLLSYGKFSSNRSHTHTSNCWQQFSITYRAWFRITVNIFRTESSPKFQTTPKVYVKFSLTFMYISNGKRIKIMKEKFKQMFDNGVPMVLIFTRYRYFPNLHF